MDKIVISPNEITEIKEGPDVPARIEPKLPPAIPWWARLSVGISGFVPAAVVPGHHYYAGGASRAGTQDSLCVDSFSFDTF